MTAHATRSQAQEVLRKMERSTMENTRITVSLEEERNTLQGTVDTLQEELELVIGERDLSQAVLKTTLADSLSTQERIENIKAELRATLTHSENACKFRPPLDMAGSLTAKLTGRAWTTAQIQQLRRI
jgi:hypothetical protein